LPAQEREGHSEPEHHTPGALAAIGGQAAVERSLIFIDPFE
jgi:hypothetical protein